MNASKKKATKSFKKMERGLEQSLQSLAKTRNTKSINKQKFNRNRDSQEGSYNGGRIDRFPRGNKQGMGFGNKQSIIVQESEYIGEVTSNSTAFSLLSTYPINPGQAVTFPWLSTIAKNYEKYEFLSLQWIYKPEVSQYATNGQTGKVLLSVDYDASDAQPQNKMQMEDVVPHSDAMPYQQLKLNCRPKEMHQNSDAKFVRPGNLPGQSDIKTYDAGNLFVGTSGIATNTGILGELHVKYIVKLSIPILESQGAQQNNTLASFNDSAGQALVTSTTKIDPLATVTANGINVVNTGGSFIAPPGNYLVFWNPIYLGSTQNITSTQSFIEVNGSVIGQTATNAGVGVEEVGSSLNGFWKSDGTNATVLNLIAFAVFATGTATVQGVLNIQSI